MTPEETLALVARVRELESSTPFSLREVTVALRTETARNRAAIQEREKAEARVRELEEELSSCACARPRRA